MSHRCSGTFTYRSIDSTQWTWAGWTIMSISYIYISYISSIHYCIEIYVYIYDYAGYDRWCVLNILCFNRWELMMDHAIEWRQSEYRPACVSPPATSIFQYAWSRGKNIKQQQTATTTINCFTTSSKSIMNITSQQCFSIYHDSKNMKRYGLDLDLRVDDIPSGYLT